jgi:(1->4)-alpha-D-glucan 1-alpha-D-glucosylmutase
MPVSTYRLQLNSGFTFRDARSVVDYLHDLGIGDCYASSYLAAVPGSPHGYDVADPTRLNSDIGTDDEYWAWIDALHAHGMGHVIDVVPNHMGIAKSANPWWLDVLENGPSSRFARCFDIEWHPIKDELADKVLIPVLGDMYGEVLERQELVLQYRNGAFAVHYYDETLPIAPDTYPMIVEAGLPAWLADHPGDDADELQSILTAASHLPPRSARGEDAIATRAREKEIVKRRLADLTARSAAVAALVDAAVRRTNGTADQARSFDALDQLLNAQSYRLAHWRVASEEINYRRFFDINQLAALRMEDPAVFEEVHHFLFGLVERGAATGLRIDHVDGLFNPGDYLQRLQDRVGPFYVVVEKILGSDEQLPRDWPIAGTTGYEFAAVVNHLFVDRRNENALDEIYRRFIRERRDPQSFGDIAYASKKRILHETMSGDINSLGHQLNRFSELNRHTRDFTLYNLISTIKEVIACFPVYRTYVSAHEPVSDHDRRYIARAIECAKRRAPGMTSLAFDFIERLLLKQTPAFTPEACDARARFAGKFQQITSPVAAKGLEDTALYQYVRLVSLNEVGSDPTIFGLDAADVHDWMRRRQAAWPGALSTTSTHDTKRGEDVRARIDVLSEIPGAWKTAVAKWRALNRRHKTDVGVLAPDPVDEYLLYQTLIGAWPFETDVRTEESLRVRLQDYMRKAMREAKRRTSWITPNEDYESAVLRFVAAILDRRRSAPFLHVFLPFQARVAELGMYTSLAQLTIKLTAPGVPDFYQGTEFWDLSLVDPDNRRPVDYEKRRQALAALKGCATDNVGGGSAVAQAFRPADVAELLEHRRDGRVKLFVTARGLHARSACRDLFERGEYVALTATGPRRESVFAFARTLDGRQAITIVPRLIAMLIPDAATLPVGRPVWGDTRVPLADARARRFRDAFTGATFDTEEIDGLPTLAVGDVLARFPVAVLLPA